MWLIEKEKRLRNIDKAALIWKKTDFEILVKAVSDILTWR